MLSQWRLKKQFAGLFSYAFFLHGHALKAWLNEEVTWTEFRPSATGVAHE